MVTESTDNKQQEPKVDSAVKASENARSGAIIAAAIAGLLGVIAAIVPAYIVGRNNGEQAATPATVTETVQNTVTETVSAAPSTVAGNGGQVDPSSTPSPGNVHLADLRLSGGHENVVVGKASVRNAEYSRTVMTTDSCPEAEYFAYNIPQGMRVFHAIVGLRDDSPTAITAQFNIRVDGTSRTGVAVEVGKTAEITVDVSGNILLEMSFKFPGNEQCGATGVLIDPVLRP